MPHIHTFLDGDCIDRKAYIFTNFSGCDTTRNVLLPTEPLVYELYKCVYVKYQQKGKEEHVYSLFYSVRYSH